MHTSQLIPFVTLCSLLTTAVQARPVPAWSYEKLLKEADLVVIAVPTAIRDATPEDRLVSPAGLEGHVAGVVTSFRILAVLKGKHDKPTLDIKHFREIPVNNGYLGNGPCFVTFKDMLVKNPVAAEDSKSQCLLFLRTLTNGEREFVTGQEDPIFSVKQMRDVPMQWPE